MRHRETEREERERERGKSKVKRGPSSEGPWGTLEKVRTPDRSIAAKLFPPNAETTPRRKTHPLAARLVVLLLSVTLLFLFQGTKTWKYTLSTKAHLLQCIDKSM